jgi:hypothetical protein
LHVLSRPMPISMHAHCSLTLPLPHTRRCGDAMLAYAALLCSAAAAACCVAAYHGMPGWTCGQCHPPSWLLCELLHTNTLSPSVHCPDRASAVSCSTRRCGRAYQRYSNTRPCRVPVADGARRGLTARHHTPRQLGLPPFHREPQRACRPGGPWRAGCRLPRCVTHYSSISLSHLALHTLLPSRPCLPIATKTTCSV